MPFLNPDDSEQDRRIDGWNNTYPKPWREKTAMYFGHKVWHGVWYRDGDAGGWRRQITFVRLSPMGATINAFYSLIDHKDREIWYRYNPAPMFKEQVEADFKTRPANKKQQPYMLAWSAARNGLWMIPGGLDAPSTYVEKVGDQAVWGFLRDVLP
jgi:hypothetical protein